MTFRIDRPRVNTCTLFVSACLMALIVGCRPPEAANPSATQAASAAQSPASSAADHAHTDVASVFQTSSDVLFTATSAAEFSKFQPLQMVKLQAADDGLHITATGNDPSVFVPEFPFKPCIVKVDLTAPGESAAQIFYLVGTETVYTEQHSAVQKIKAGRNVLYFRISTPNVSGKWRFDPGDLAGEFVLHSMEVRATAMASP